MTIVSSFNPDLLLTTMLLEILNAISELTQAGQTVNRAFIIFNLVLGDFA